jgi:hypothetical protein
VDIALRPLMPDDASTVRAFVSGYFEAPRYRARALEALQCALNFDDPEYMALIAVDETSEAAAPSDALAGVALFGTVAGAHAVVKLHGVLAREAASARSLVEAVVRASQQSGERMIVCELPDDAPFAIAAAALLATGFTEQGRVPDFVRDGVALRLLVRPLLEA